MKIIEIGGYCLNYLPENPNIQVDFSKSQLATIHVAGGCFWGVEAFIARVLGVADTSVGYANGVSTDPSYKEVCTGKTGHAETVAIHYDPKVLTLEHLLEKFFEIIEPTSLNKQGGDVGSQYRTGIYYTNESDLPTIQKIIEQVQQQYDKPIVTEVKPLDNYYLAEEYHQKYLEKNPDGYCHISFKTLQD